MLNKVILQGRLVADPELRTTKSGVNCCLFRLAVDRNTKEKQADFISCVAWRGTADFVKRYFRKGNMLLADGSLQTRNYLTQSGEKRYVTEIAVQSVNFCGGKEEDADVNQDVKPYDFSQIANQFEELEPDGELPF